MSAIDVPITSEVLTVTMPSPRELIMTRGISAPRQRVFDAWTRPEQVPHWMLGPDGWTMPVCEIDLRPGGSWHFVWRKTDGSEMAVTGTYQEITPPGRLASTESWGAGWPETLNTVVLAEETPDRTIITEAILYPSREARDAALQTGMTKGVAASLDRLAAYLRSSDREA